MARLSAALALLTALVSHGALASEFRITRWSEDWRAHATAESHRSALEAIKYLPLSDADYLSLGGQVRYKAVSSAAPLFGLGRATTDGYVFQRVNLHADLHLGEPLRAFVEIGDARVFGKDDRNAPIDGDRSELMQAFVDWVLPLDAARLQLRLGRQELAFDNLQRFVALREGPNVRRSHEGVRLSAVRGALEANGFYVRPVANEDGQAFDNRADQCLAFGGLRLRWRASAAQQLDGYWYHYRRDEASFGGVRAAERREMLGLQGSGRHGGFDWDIEAAFQHGEFGDAAVRAWAFGSLLGHQWRDWRWRPRVGLQFDAASGDRDPADDRLQTFNALFAKGSYFSQAGLTDFANLLHGGAFLTLQASERASLGAAVGRTARESRADAAYAQPMLAIPRSVTGGKGIGRYWRLNAAYRLNAHLNLAAEALHEVPDDNLRAAGARTVDYAELVLKFLF